MNGVAAHPADRLDVAEAVRRMHESLTTGRYWDDLATSLRPELAAIGGEHVEDVLCTCPDMGFTQDEEIDPRSPEADALIRRWCAERAEDMVASLRSMSVADGRVEADRLIACEPAELRNPLGPFWTWNIEDWCDAYSPWAPMGRDGTTVVVRCSVAVEHVDWPTTLLAAMDWYCGSEHELRIIPGSPVRLLSGRIHGTDETFGIPDLRWTA